MANETKWTPGPWRTMGDHDIVTDTAPANCRHLAWTTSGKAFNADGTDEAERIANARLIAAAPDLFAALERWHRFAVDNGYTDADYHDADGTGWISETAAALAKARGDAEGGAS